MFPRLQAVLRTFTVFSQRNHYDEALFKALCCRVRLATITQRHRVTWALRLASGLAMRWTGSGKAHLSPARWVAAASGAA